MNIIFEGISGCGKTTTIDSLCELLDKKGILYEKIGDLQYDTPLKENLIEMVTRSPFMDQNGNFKTSLYESLLLAANHHYIQEKLRDSKKLCIYDRDFISVLAYQKEILKKDYENWEKIYQIYRDLILFNLKSVDYIVYMMLPFEEALRRTEIRDNRKFSAEDIEKLKIMRENMEFELSLIDNGNNIIYLDGMDSIKDNVRKLAKKLAVRK